ncbi:hypothetical protein ABD440_10015, partial [Chromobacterium piscinae]|uniref:hypothetical protein n=1 Tax=Chromobacterium piscinae TaxID=686831 RepID=UPI0031FC47EB
MILQLQAGLRAWPYEHLDNGATIIPFCTRRPESGWQGFKPPICSTPRDASARLVSAAPCQPLFERGFAGCRGGLGSPRGWPHS